MTNQEVALACSWIAPALSTKPSTRERTSCERINSQAKELGIERRHPSTMDALLPISIR
jgi:hypothetical protein